MRREEGFTLVELLVAMALGGLVMAAIYATYTSQQKAYLVTEQTTAVQQNIRGAMYFIERDLRLAGYDPRRTNDFGFTNISSGVSVAFTMDYTVGSQTSTTNENGSIDGTETVAYELSGTNLRRKVGGSSPQTIAENITALNLSYRDSKDLVTLVPANVRAVVVTVTGSDGGHSRTMTTRVKCRNIGL
jgi:type IV pilus assembly protein PilW